MDFASWKDRKSVAQALRTVYRAADAAAGQAALDAFAQGSGGIKYPAIAQSWRRNWELVIPFFAFPEGVRRIIYTTDAIEVFSATPLRTGVENPKNRFKHAPCRDRLSSRTAIGNVLLRKMLPDPIPLLVSQPNHPTFIADRHPFVILR